MQVVLIGWLEQKQEVPQEVQAYFTSRDEFSVQDGLLFKSDRVIIRTSLRQHAIQKINNSDMGIEESLHIAREIYYWPLRNAEIRDHVAQYSVCNSFRPEQCREELKPHELHDRPWSKVGIDSCYI